MPGSGVCERRPALLVPGYTGSKEDFLAVLQPLAVAGRRVLAIDMRGQYETPGAADHRHYQPDALAADVAGIATAISQDGQGVHLLGHSLGGLITRQVVLAQTAPITSLTFLGSGPGSLNGPRAAALRATLADLDKAGPAHRSERISQLWDTEFGPQAIADGVPPHIVAFLRERMLRSAPEGLVAMGRYLLHCPDQTAALAALAAVAILVLYGENDDAWAPSAQERMARRLGAERVCIPAAAHSPAIEAPETTAGTLTSFWNAAEGSERRRKAAVQGAAPAGRGSPAAELSGAGPAATELSGEGSPAAELSGAEAAVTEPADAGPPAASVTSSAGAAGASASQGRRGSAASMPSGQCAR
jgi:pimeloyl-ACP methyl ester carboxylesterase